MIRTLTLLSVFSLSLFAAPKANPRVVPIPECHVNCPYVVPIPECHVNCPYVVPIPECHVNCPYVK